MRFVSKEKQKKTESKIERKRAFHMIEDGNVKMLKESKKKLNFVCFISFLFFFC